MSRPSALFVLFAASAGMVLSRPVRAQDTTARSVPTVRVTVTRDAARSPFELPYGVTRTSVDETRSGTRRSSLTEMLQFIPGVTVANRFNPTQDPRLSVRGFGARSAFGIRGVRVLRDGIPLTLADGQTAVDYLDLETVDAVEVFRGSAGALYGNSSGGVVDFRTRAPADSGLSWRAGTSYSEAATRQSLSAALRRRTGSVSGTVSGTQGDGARTYSRFRNTSVMGDARFSTLATDWQAQLTLYDSPLAENPGALTATELKNTPDVADPTNITRKASKQVSQVVASLQASRDWAGASWNANVQLGARELTNPQSFAIVDFDRATSGASLRGQRGFGLGARNVRLGLGADLLNQLDDRFNYTNCAGLTGSARPAATCPTASDIGSVTLHQRERVSGLGAFARAELAMTERLSITGTLRSDQTRFSVADLRPTQSSAVAVAPVRRMGAVTPMVGVNWRVGALASLYANIASSFETPTTTELANQPDGRGGLNTVLKPQHGTSYELGARGMLGTATRWDVSLFRISTTDELIPFEVPGGGGRRFFRNAGRTSRTGGEVSASRDAGPITLGGTAAWLRYRYDDFVVSGTSFNGKRVPGVSPLSVNAFASWRPTWGSITAEAQRVGRQAADDANTTFADGYTVLNLRASLDVRGRLGLQPSLGVDNLLDATYASNVVVNAARGRFYEPGPPRTVWAGLRLRLAR